MSSASSPPPARSSASSGRGGDAVGCVPAGRGAERDAGQHDADDRRVGLQRQRRRTGASSRTPRISSTSTATAATKTSSAARPRRQHVSGPAARPRRPRGPRSAGRRARRHARVRRAPEPPVEVDHGRAARPAALRLDRDERVDGGDDARRRDERDRARVVDGRRGEAEARAIRRGEEGEPADDASDSGVASAPSRSITAPVASAWWVRLRPTSVNGTPLASTAAAASGSAQALNSA